MSIYRDRLLDIIFNSWNVLKKIAGEVWNTNDALLFDGWTNNFAHYVAII